MPRQIALIGNHASGQGGAKDSAEAIANALQKHGIAAQVRLFDAHTTLEQEVHAAVHAGAQIVAALGGDGTANAVASALSAIGKRNNKTRGAGDTALAIVPLGTFNYAARLYELPTEAEDIARMLAAGKTRTIAAGSANGRLFLNNCSIGLYTNIIEARERSTRTWGRWRGVAVLSALFAALRPHARRQLTVEADGRSTWHGRASLVFAGVNPMQFDNAGIPELAEHVRQGQVGVAIVSKIDGLRLAKIAWSAQVGTVRELEEVSTLAAPAICVRMRKRRIRAVIDGETVWLQTPLHIRLESSALRLVVP